MVLGKGGGFFCAALMRFERLSRWKGSVGVLSSVSALRAESADFLGSFSSLMLFCNCWSLPGVNISSTSVRKIFPLKTSTMFVVTSVKVHLEGVLAGVGAVLWRARPRRFLFPCFFFLTTDIDRDAWILTVEPEDLGLFFRMLRDSGELRGRDVSVSYHP